MAVIELQLIDPETEHIVARAICRTSDEPCDCALPLPEGTGWLEIAVKPDRWIEIGGLQIASRGGEVVWRLDPQEERPPIDLSRLLLSRDGKKRLAGTGRERLGLDIAKLPRRLEAGATLVVTMRDLADADIAREAGPIIARQAQEISALKVEMDTRLASLALERDDRVSSLAADKARDISSLTVELYDARERASSAEAQLTSVLGSTSWRVTAPLRRALGVARAAKLRVASRAAAYLPQDQLQPGVRKHPAMRRMEEDYSAAIPFPFGPRLAEAPGRIAVLCHIYHAELAPEMLSYLGNIPFDADVFITTDTERKRALIERHCKNWKLDRAELRVMPNRGRDIAPKLVGMRDVHERYDYVLHLHSKQSVHEDDLSVWRGYNLQTLIGSPEIVQSIFTIFQRCPNVGMILPQHLDVLRVWIHWAANFAPADGLARRLGIAITPDHIIDFPSGSMFWARSAALRPLLDLALSFEEFPEERGQLDGTLAHAVERLYLLVCERAGYDWMKVANPEFFLPRQSIAPIRSLADLDHFVAHHTMSLLKTPPVPTGAEPVPPPAITEWPPRGLVRALNAHALGTDRQRAPVRVAIGIVTGETPAEQLLRSIHSAQIALATLDTRGRLLLLYAEASTEDLTSGLDVTHIAAADKIGRAAGHNRLMNAAFAAGAEAYVIMPPGSALEPAAIESLGRMIRAFENRVLVQALRYPEEGPRRYGSLSFEAGCLSAAGLAIPRVVYEEIGGFDESFADCEDTDFAWRARAVGIPLRVCPAARLLYDADRTTSSPAQARIEVLSSAARLARKWGNSDCERRALQELAALGGALPSLDVEPVPESWHAIPDFSDPQLPFNRR